MSIQYNQIDNLKVTKNFKAKGVPHIYSFTFNFDTPDLNIGVPVYTPSKGEVLLDAWTDTNVDFNGTGLKWDLGTFNPLADNPDQGMMRYWFSANPELSSYYYSGQVDFHLTDAAPNSFSTVSTQYANEGDSYPWQVVFDTSSTIKLVVSQDGLSGGPSIGGTQGSGTLYIMVVKPQKLN